MGAASNGAVPKTGQVVTNASTAVRLLAVATGSAQGTGRAGSGVLVKALVANAAIVYVGDSTVTTSTGFPLSAGDTLSLPIDDASKLWAISASVTPTLAFIYL